MSAYLDMKVDVRVPLSPEHAATAFTDFTADDQTKFFNAVAVEVAKWGRPFGFQLAAVTSDPALTDEAREIMREIGEYSAED